jgi:hypothetical protein
MSIKRPTNLHLAALNRSIATLRQIVVNPNLHTDARKLAKHDLTLLIEVKRILLDYKFQPHLYN